MSPASWPLPRLSRKKHSTPPKTQTQARRSRRWGLSRNTSQEKRITKMGAVNCRRTALPAVVSLLATVYRMVAPNTASPLPAPRG